MQSFLTVNSDLKEAMLKLLGKLKSDKFHLPDNQVIQRYNDYLATDITKFEANALLSIAGYTADQDNTMTNIIVQIVDSGAIERLEQLKEAIENNSESTYKKLIQINGLITDLGKAFFIKPLMTTKNLKNDEKANKPERFVHKVTNLLRNKITGLPPY
jgi:hypothetical protein